MKLLVDDLRDLPADIIARNFTAGKLLLENFTWDTLLLDHDLGEDPTGYDLINFAITGNFVPKEVIIVSSNPVGRDNISAALRSYGYHQLTPFHLFKKP